VCLLRGTDWVFKYNSREHKNPRSAHTVYLCVLCGSQNKQPFFAYTALTGWFYNRDGVFTARYGLDMWFSSVFAIKWSIQVVENGLLIR
jgi:hypothetical protein